MALFRKLMKDIKSIGKSLSGDNCATLFMFLKPLQNKSYILRLQSLLLFVYG